MTQTNFAPHIIYLSLMRSIRQRLDMVERLAGANEDSFTRAETAAFHGRKIIEGIAFGCLVTTEHGLKHIPRDAKGKWNAEEILRGLQKKSIHTFPSPSDLRLATPEEIASSRAKVTIEGTADRRVTYAELIAIYQRLHRWLHEMNPYVMASREDFYSAHGEQLWADLRKVDRFIERHFISIQGEGFFCTLRDRHDGQTKVFSIASLSD